MRIIYILLTLLLSLYILKKYVRLNKTDCLIIFIFFLFNFYYLLKEKNTILLVLNLLINSFLILVFIVDKKEMWIPDLSVISILILQSLKVFSNCLLYSEKIKFSGIIIVVIYSFIFFLISFTMKKELIGFGDLKLLFVLAIDKQIMEVVFMLLTASILGIIINIKKKGKFPFGPEIVISYLLMLI